MSEKVPGSESRDFMVQVSEQRLIRPAQHDFAALFRDPIAGRFYEEALAEIELANSFFGGQRRAANQPARGAPKARHHMNCAANGATAAITVAKHECEDRKRLRLPGNSELRRPSQRQKPIAARSSRQMNRQMDAVDDGDDAIEPVHAVKSIRHRKDDDRQQEEQIEEGLRRGCLPARR